MGEKRDTAFGVTEDTMLTSLIRRSLFRFAIFFALLAPWPARLGAQHNAPSLMV